jgi:hypothetical protein
LRLSRLKGGNAWGGSMGAASPACLDTGANGRARTHSPLQPRQLPGARKAGTRKACRAESQRRSHTP